MLSTSIQLLGLSLDTRETFRALLFYSVCVCISTEESFVQNAHEQFGSIYFIQENYFITFLANG